MGAGSLHIAPFTVHLHPLSFSAMFDWLKRKIPLRPADQPPDAVAVPSAQSRTTPTASPHEPNTSAANPGKYLKGKFTFTGGNKSWLEEVNAIHCMTEALKGGGQSFTAHKSWVELAGGFTIMPRFVSFQPLDSGSVQTVTTVEVSNPAGIPPAVFEFQHSTGDNVRDSFVKGFESWMQTDLPVFMDALREQPKQCTFLQIELPAGSGKRRAVLGPVAHLVPKPLREQKQPEVGEEHPFCPCCLFTKTGDIWKKRFPMEDFMAFGYLRCAGRRVNQRPTAGSTAWIGKKESRRSLNTSIHGQI
jgi:hypothetical protein